MDISIILSVLAFALDQGINSWKERARRIVDSESETIRDYTDWLRRKEFNELLDQINGNRERLDQLISTTQDIDEINHTLTLAVAKDSEILFKLRKIDANLVPNAISPLPRHFRDLFSSPLLFRDEELQLMNNMEGDFVVSGQPGAGKTFLAYHFCKDLAGQFVISESEDEVIKNLRISCPPLLVVDDAGDKGKLLERLRHFRATSGKTFRIVGICWSYEVQQTLARMDLTKSSLISLDLVSADDMASYIRDRGKAMGYELNDALVREIRIQASGRIGLASRILELVLRTKSTEPLLRAEIYDELLQRAYKDNELDETYYVLAGFAVGGEHGMPIGDLAHTLKRDRQSITRLLKALETGGIISVASPDTISVHPAPFRHALLVKIFLTKNVYSYSDMFNNIYALARHKNSALHCLIGAIEKGAHIDKNWLIEQVLQHGTRQTWSKLAGASEEMCALVIERHPEKLECVTEPLLYYFPERTLEMLLTRSSPGSKLEESSAENLMKVLSTWIKGEHSDTKRRFLLLKVAEKLLRGGGDPDVSWFAISIGMSIQFEYHKSDAGEGSTVTFYSGYLPFDEIKRLAFVWMDKLLPLLQSNPPENLKIIADAIDGWLNLETYRTAPPEELRQLTKDTAARFARDLFQTFDSAPLGFARWGLKNKLWSIDKTDQEFIAYAPVERRQMSTNWEDWERANQKTASDLGIKFTQFRPKQVSAKLCVMERECQQWGINWPKNDYLICKAIADKCSDVSEWILSLIEEGATSVMMSPFILKLLQKSDWLLVRALIDEDEYFPETLSELVKIDALPDDIIEASVTRWMQLSSTTSVSYRLSNRMTLLWAIRLANEAQGRAALELALTDFRSERRVLLHHDRDAWIALFMRGVPHFDFFSSEYIWDINEVIKAVPELRLPLASHLLEKDTFLIPEFCLPAKSIFDGLSQNERISLLSKLENLYRCELTSFLIGDEPYLYEELLKNNRNRRQHLVPLAGKPTHESWQSKALLASEYGYSHNVIVEAATGNIVSISGDKSTFFRNWKEEFQNLLSITSHPTLIAIAQTGVDMFAAREESSLTSEKMKRIHGMHDND